jgi:hypothetical protein
MNVSLSLPANAGNSNQETVTAGIHRSSGPAIPLIGRNRQSAARLEVFNQLFFPGDKTLRLVACKNAQVAEPPLIYLNRSAEYSHLFPTRLSSR